MTTSDLISYYGAVLATVVFIWQIFQYIDERKGKLSITASIRTMMPVYANRQTGEAEPFLNAAITNREKNIRFINRPGLILDAKYENGKFLSLIDFESRINFPVELPPGKLYDHTVPLENGHTVLKKNGVRKILVLVEDTHGKKYRSNWLYL